MNPPDFIQPIAGQNVTAVAAEGPLRVSIGSTWALTVEGIIVYTGPGGAGQRWDGDDPVTAHALGGLLLGQEIANARLDAGRLHLAFTSGAAVRLDPDAHYESWSLTGPGRLLIVCLASGETAVWHQEATAPPEPPG